MRKSERGILLTMKSIKKIKDIIASDIVAFSTMGVIFVANIAAVVYVAL